MIVLVVRKADDVVMPLRQNSPKPRPGAMITATVKKYGGVPTDYEELIVEEKDEAKIMSAKELVYNPIKKQIDVIAYTDKEKGLREKNEQYDGVREQLVKWYCYEQAAITLGVPAQSFTARKDAAQNRYDRLAQEIDDLENLPDGD